MAEESEPRADIEDDSAIVASTADVTEPDPTNDMAPRSRVVGLPRDSKNPLATSWETPDLDLRIKLPAVSRPPVFRLQMLGIRYFAGDLRQSTGRAVGLQNNEQRRVGIHPWSPSRKHVVDAAIIGRQDSPAPETAHHRHVECPCGSDRTTHLRDTLNSGVQVSGQLPH
jgi:hypothetical protein